MQKGGGSESVRLLKAREPVTALIDGETDMIRLDHACTISGSPGIHRGYY